MYFTSNAYSPKKGTSPLYTAADRTQTCSHKEPVSQRSCIPQYAMLRQQTKKNSGIINNWVFLEVEVLDIHFTGTA